MPGNLHRLQFVQPIELFGVLLSPFRLQSIVFPACESSREGGGLSSNKPQPDTALSHHPPSTPPRPSWLSPLGSASPALVLNSM